MTSPSEIPLHQLAMMQQSMHVVYGSRSRTGLHHDNEDRHAVSYWPAWCSQSPVADNSDHSSGLNGNGNSIINGNYCETRGTFQRGVPTIGGTVGTGLASDEFNLLQMQLGEYGNMDSTADQKSLMLTVCDGHDGAQAADYICKYLGPTFQKACKRFEEKDKTDREESEDHVADPTKTSSNSNLTTAVSPTQPLGGHDKGWLYSRALARSYECIERAFKQHCSNPDTPDGRPYIQTSGSCATSVFLSNNMICCAGLGDCKAAILSLEGGTQSADNTFQITWFSKAHRSDCPQERARVKARGGWFRNGRVGGVLEPTRTIGDFDVKDTQPENVIIAVPEVRTYAVSKPTLMLLCSDGVWDVMTPSQLLSTLKRKKKLWSGILSWLGAEDGGDVSGQRRGIRNFFRRRAKSKEGLSGFFNLPSPGDLTAMADAIVNRAHDLGSDDDCTCVVVMLRPILYDIGPQPTAETPMTAPMRSGEIDNEEEDESDDDDLLEEIQLELDDPQLGQISDRTSVAIDNRAPIPVLRAFEKLATRAGSDQEGEDDEDDDTINQGNVEEGGNPDDIISTRLGRIGSDLASVTVPSAQPEDDDPSISAFEESRRQQRLQRISALRMRLDPPNPARL